MSNSAGGSDPLAPPVGPGTPVSPIESIRLSKLITGVVGTQLVYIAAKLSLADHLASGPKSSTELAQISRVDTARLARLLRAMASLGLVSELQDGRYALAPLGMGLRSDLAESQRDFALMMGSPWHISGWGNIARALDTDVSAFEAVFGETLFEFLDRHPEDSTVFGNAMAFTSRRHAKAIIDAYDFGSAGTVVDVGGGHGQLLADLLGRHPEATGVVFDLPAVAERAKDVFAAAKLSDRCSVVGGSFFDAVPSDGDVYILKYIIHDWDDDRAVTILGNCRRAMRPNSKLLIIDVILPERNAPFAKTWPDIEMLVLLPNGKERTQAEFDQLLARAGLSLVRSLPTRSELSILEVMA